MQAGVCACVVRVRVLLRQNLIVMLQIEQRIGNLWLFAASVVPGDSERN